MLLDRLVLHSYVLLTLVNQSQRSLTSHRTSTERFVPLIILSVELLFSVIKERQVYTQSCMSEFIHGGDSVRRTFVTK